MMATRTSVELGSRMFHERALFLKNSTPASLCVSIIETETFILPILLLLGTDLRPKVKDHYRADKMALWSKLIPELLSNNNGRITSSDDEEEESSMTHHHSTGTAGGLFYFGSRYTCYLGR